MEGYTELDLKYLLDILDSLKKDESDCECECCEHTNEENAPELALELPTVNLHIDNINFTFNFFAKDCDE